MPSDEPQQPANAEDKGKGKGFGDGSGDAAVGDGPAKGQTQGKAPGKGSKPPEEKSDPTDAYCWLNQGLGSRCRKKVNDETGNEVGSEDRSTRSLSRSVTFQSGADSFH